MYHSADHGVVDRRPVAPAGRDLPGLASRASCAAPHRGRRGARRRRRDAGRRGRRSSQLAQIRASAPRIRSSPSARERRHLRARLDGGPAGAATLEVVVPQRGSAARPGARLPTCVRSGPIAPAGAGAAHGVAGAAAVRRERPPRPRRAGVAGGRGGLGAPARRARRRSRRARSPRRRRPSARARCRSTRRRRRGTSPVRVGSSVEMRGAAGNHVHLAGERRHPEGVDDVVARQLHVAAGRPAGAARWPGRRRRRRRRG